MLIPAIDTSNTPLTGEAAISPHFTAKSTHHYYSCHKCGPKQVLRFQTRPTATFLMSQICTFSVWKEMSEAEKQRSEHFPSCDCSGLRVRRQKVTIIKFCNIIWFSCQCMRRIEANENKFDDYTHKQIKSGSYINVCQSP